MTSPNTTSVQASVKSPFEIIAEIPSVKFEVTDAAVRTAKAKLRGIRLPKAKGGADMTAEMLVAMGNASAIAKNVDEGLTRLSYLVGAAIASDEWKGLYPIINKEGEYVLRNKPFKNASEFISYMLPETARSTAMNYVSAVVNVLLPAKAGKLPELPECADMTIGMASNIKSAIVDESLRPHLVQAYKALHKEKGNKDAPLTRSEWKSVIANAKEAAGKTNGNPKAAVNGANAEDTPVSSKSAASYYALLALFGATSGEVPESARISKDNMDKLRNLVNNVYSGKLEDAAAFVEAFAGVLNGTKPE